MKFSSCMLVALCLALNLYGQDSKQVENVQKFKADFGGKMIVKWNKSANCPSKIYADNISFKNYLGEENVSDCVENFAYNYSGLFNIANSEITLKSVQKHGSGYVVCFSQIYKGIPVWRSSLKVVVGKNGKVPYITSRLYDMRDVSVYPALNDSQARAKVLDNFSLEDEECVFLSNELCFYQNQKNEMILCWQVIVSSRQQNLSLEFLIDAQKGNIVDVFNGMRNLSVSGILDFTVWSNEQYPDATPDLVEGVDSLVVVLEDPPYFATEYTDSDGDYYFNDVPYGSYTFIAQLITSHCIVENADDYVGTDEHITVVDAGDTHNWSFQSSSHYKEYNLLYYMESAWKNYYEIPDFSYNPCCFSSVVQGKANDPTLSGINGVANYNTKTLSISTANIYGNTIYHEYSHLVLNYINESPISFSDTSEARALEEGLVDYFACSFTGAPMIYGIERSLDGGLAYPGTGDVHSRGRVVGGACWDLRQSGAMSADSTNEMIYRAISYLDVGDDSLKFADLLDALLISDDAWNGIGDNDITNGTPHDDQIFDAFLNDHAILGDFLAGTISENYTITNDTITLISDVSVAASKILTISDGTVIDLNGYKITCGSNGKIVRQGTVEFLPKDIYIKSGSDIISQYSTLSSAFSVFTTGETLVVNDGTHALTDNVTVSSGSTLELKPGTTLQFASGKKLTVNGTLLSVGTGSLITFEASGYGTWYGIDFTSSSSSNNVINSIFEDMTNGLVYTNCSYSNTIYGGEFDNNDISVNIINSSVTLGNCEIQNSDDYGVKCSSAGSMSALTDNIFADNYIGIWGDSNSSLHLGWDLATGGYNSIYNLAYDIQSNYSGTIYAEDNWWGGVPPSPSFGGSATIDYDPYLSSDPNSSGGLEKANSTNKPVSLVNEGEFVLSNRGNIDTTGIHEFDQIYLLVVNKDNQTALPLMENLVNKYPSSLAGELALIWVNRLCNDLHIKTHAVEFLQAYGKKEIKTRLSAQARGLLINQMVNANEFSQAAAAAEDLLQDHIASDIDKMTLFELATIYWYYLDEKESGKLYFQEYIKNYPNDDLAASARITLGIDLAKSEFEKGISPSPIEDNVILPESYELYQNYPNPFNPTTTIKYSIMEPGRVNIDLFNIRGEKVITLFDDEKTAGTHMVQFIASHLPSGIYFYQITCNEFNMIRKMILLK